MHDHALLSTGLASSTPKPRSSPFARMNCAPCPNNAKNIRSANTPWSDSEHRRDAQPELWRRAGQHATARGRAGGWHGRSRWWPRGRRGAAESAWHAQVSSSGGLERLASDYRASGRALECVAEAHERGVLRRKPRSTAHGLRDQQHFQRPTSALDQEPARLPQGQSAVDFRRCRRREQLPHRIQLFGAG
jgi:hypothetical protein